jgi:hypothetical protein
MFLVEILIKKNSSLKSNILHGQFEKQILHWVRFDILHANFEEEISSLCEIWHSSQMIREKNSSLNEIWHCSCKIWGSKFFTK